MSLPGWTGRLSRQRRLIQTAFLFVFAALPALDLFRFDFVSGRFHFFRQEIWLDEWTLLWLALMFAMWVVAAASLILGRVYCAYACPQMVFSEFANDLDALARKIVRNVSPPRRDGAARVVSLGLLAPVAIVVSVLTMGYFAPVPYVLLRLGHFDAGFGVGAIGAVIAALFFLDFAFLRERFCRSACPYGLLQGILEDGRSLHVTFDESTGACLQCRLCEKACPMGIDIRRGSFQIECTRCGSCVDACGHVLGKRGRPGLLAFDFSNLSLRHWDAKRVLVAVSTLGFGVALVVSIALRERVSFRLSPVYTEAAASRGDVAESRFLLRATNKGTTPTVLDVRSEGLPPGASVLGLSDPNLPGGEERRITLTVRVPRSAISAGVTEFSLVVTAANRSETFPAALYVAGPTAG